MDIWQDVEQRIEEHGVRTHQRTEFLRAIREHAASGGSLEQFLRQRHDEALRAVKDAADDVQRALRT